MAGPPTAEPATYCGRCGEPAGDPGSAAGAHDQCARDLQLEPPRYCVHCRRRMVVQVTPDGWSARCVAHGTLTGSTWAS
jgi:hypothetical protein